MLAMGSREGTGYPWPRLWLPLPHPPHPPLPFDVPLCQCRSAPIKRSSPVPRWYWFIDIQVQTDARQPGCEPVVRPFAITSPFASTYQRQSILGLVVFGRRALDPFRGHTLEDSIRLLTYQPSSALPEDRPHR